MNIAVKNFRVFENYQNFEIRPLTLLVGPNNTGKSALGKLLQLLKNGTFKLDFENSGIDCFINAINWNHPTDGFQFTFPAYTGFLPSMEVTVNYKDGICDSVEMTQYDDERFTVLDIRRTDDKTYNLFFNYKWLIDCFYTDRLYYKNTLSGSKIRDINISEFRPLPPYSKIIAIEKEISKYSLAQGAYRLDLLNKLFYKQREYLFENDAELKLFSKSYSPSLTEDEPGVYDRKFYSMLPFFSLVDEIFSNRTTPSYCLFEVFENFENVTELYEEKIIEIQDEIFRNIKIELTDDFVNNNLVTDFIKSEFQKKFLQLVPFTNITFEQNKLFEIIFENKILKDSYDDENPNTKSYTLWSELLNQLFFLKENLARLYPSTAKREISGDYVRRLYEAKLKLNKTRSAFYDTIFQEAIEIFDLKKMEIEAETIWITLDDDRRTDINNLGYGYSKIIPIILGLLDLSLINIYSPYNDIFLVEEPEANLHPDFQSKLADFFNLISKYFFSVSLIVETHSEYLIRNLQFLIASNKADHRRSVIYYFNKDKFVSRYSPKIKKITIEKNGQLSEGFGKGFYDEAIRLQFELSKLALNQN